MFRLIAFILFAAILGGCQSSGWQRFYQPWNQKSSQWPPTDSASVRGVEFDAWEKADRQFKDYMKTVGRDIDDSTAADGRQLRKYLMDACDVTVDPDLVSPVGMATLQGPQLPSPNEVEAFAKKVGANLVLVGARPAGTREVTRIQPVPTFSTTQAQASAYGSGGYATAYGSANSWGWTGVPVTESVQVYEFWALFVRRISAEQRQVLNAERASVEPVKH